MSLVNLSDIYNEVINKIDEYNDAEIILSERFKRSFKDALTDNLNIEFYEHTSIYTNANDQKAYIPNQLFILAAYASQIAEHLQSYKDKIMEILDQAGKSNTEKKTLIVNAKTIPSDTELTSIIDTAQQIPEEDKEKLKSFATNYESWKGGKSFDRADFMDSPFLNILNVIHQSSGGVLNIIHTIISMKISLDDISTLFEVVKNTDEDNNNDEVSSASPNQVVNKNVIYYGAPGTGKSHDVNEIVKEEYARYDDHTHSDSGYVYRTTIYSDYSYHDFIGQIMPETRSGNVTYTFKPGIFTRALSSAINTNKNVYLIIEEMSRGNIASIFGDIFQLLDRDESGKSQYSIINENIAKEIARYKLRKEGLSSSDIETSLSSKEFANYQIKLPANLIIYGTVNTSDQNVFVLDSAFKRRFVFNYLSVSPKEVNGKYSNDFIFELDSSNKSVSWISFYQAINQFIQEQLLLPEDKLIGQFFIKGIINKDSGTDEDHRTNTDYNTKQIADKLLLYLWDDIEKANLFSSKNESIFKLKETDMQFSTVYQKFLNSEKIFDEKIYTSILEFSSNNLDDSEEISIDEQDTAINSDTETNNQ